MLKKNQILKEKWFGEKVVSGEIDRHGVKLQKKSGFGLHTIPHYRPFFNRNLKCEMVFELFFVFFPPLLLLFHMIKCISIR